MGLEDRKPRDESRVSVLLRVELISAIGGFVYAILLSRFTKDFRQFAFLSILGIAVGVSLFVVQRILGHHIMAPAPAGFFLGVVLGIAFRALEHRDQSKTSSSSNGDDSH